MAKPYKQREFIYTEIAILSTAVADPDRLAYQLTTWGDTPFSEDDYNKLWSLCKRLYSEYHYYDVAMLCDHASQEWINFDEIQEWIQSLDGVAKHYSNEAFQSILNDYSTQLVRNHLERAYSIGELEIKLKEAQEWVRDGKTSYSLLSDHIDSWEETFEQAWNGEKTPYIESGFKCLDSRGILSNGSLVILAAQASHGKTTLALNIAKNVVESGMPVLMVSLEMSKQELITKLLGNISLLPLSKIRNPKAGLDGYEFLKLQKAQETLRQLPLYVYDCFESSLFHVKETIRQFVKDNPESKLIIVDYLLLINAPSKSNRATEVDLLARELKLLAAELNVCLLVLTQLNRSVNLSADKIPSLHHLKESSGIEQHADSVVFIHRQYMLDRDNKQLEHDADICIAKARYGSLGNYKLHFWGYKGQFEERKELVYD